MTKKIPDNAQVVFKGIIHDVYQWEQIMFDGSTEIFEALKRHDGVSTVAVTNNKIIINREEQPNSEPFLSLPGGNSETGNFLEDAKRELVEETGYASDEWVEWFTEDILKYHKLEWNNHIFIAKNSTKITDQKLDSGEKIDVKLITFEEFLELRHDPKFRHKDIYPALEKAASSREEKCKLQELLGITNE